MKKLFFIVFAVVIGLSSCKKDDNINSQDNESLIVLDKDLFDTVNTQNYTILSAVISNDVLEVEIYSGGCDGNSWEVSLVDSELIAESGSYPAQRFLKISLKNEELCMAMVSKKFSFDLKPVRIEGSKILLNLQNWNDPLLYSY